MTNLNQANIERLWKLQEVSAKNLQTIADQMAAIAQGRIHVSQDRWDQLFGSWEQANQRLQDVGNELMKAHGL